MSVMIIVFLLLPTQLNIMGFNLSSCEGIPDVLWDFMYIGEIVIIAWVLGLCLKRYRILPAQDPFKKQLLYFGFGLLSFLTLFTGSNLVGQITGIQEISFIGSLGMTIFLAFLSYMIVRFHTFNLKIFATQALVVGIAVLIGSQLFFPSDVLDITITSITLMAFIISGSFLIQSVNREIESKEALKVANERQAETTSLITHQVRGVFTNTKAGLSGILEGDYGEVTQNLKEVIELMFKAQIKGVHEVETFLRAQKVESGTIQYEFKPFDLRQVVEEIAGQEKSTAEHKGLSFQVTIEPGDYNIIGDQVYLSQVVANLIDNAIRYTTKGQIEVKLSRTKDQLLCSVTDTGVGIPTEDQAMIFLKYGHGKESRKINMESSGLGLFITKGVVLGHQGKIWYESTVGKGTTFFVSLPVKPALKKI